MLAGTAKAAEPADVEGAAMAQQVVQTKGMVRIIARLATPPGVQSLTGSPLVAAHRNLASTMRAVGVTTVRPLGRFPFAALTVNAAQLQALLASGLVEAVAEDGIARPNLAESVPLVDGPQAQTAGATGAGWAVAVLDTGTDSSHPFLGGRVVAEACFSDAGGSGGGTTLCPNGQYQQVGTGAARPCTFTSTCSHGTHVAGIAAGRNATMTGVAPSAGIVAVQVFTNIGGSLGAYNSDIVLGLDQVLTFAGNGLKIASVNLSLGGSLYSTYCDSFDGGATKYAIDQLRAAGIATAIAAGNNGQDG